VPEPRELAPGHLVACHFPLIEDAPADSAAAVPAQVVIPTAPNTAKAQG